VEFYRLERITYKRGPTLMFQKHPLLGLGDTKIRNDQMEHKLHMLISGFCLKAD